MNHVDPENTSESTTSSPRSHKFTIERDVSQTSQLSAKRDSTPPSSVASSQEIYFDVPQGGRKRFADGEVKERGHTRNISTLSQASTGSLAELSASLKTKLSYAMVKVQHGWQNHSIEEVESLASLSPTSTIHAQAPASAMKKLSSEFIPAPEVASTSRGLAPSAPIVPASKKRLQINTLQSIRPQTQQRTPSQNAAMEADAVETLLFMSASPSSSSHFSNRPSISPRKVQFSPVSSRPVQRYENKSDFIDRVLESLDADDHEDLNQALSVLKAHKSEKLHV